MRRSHRRGERRLAGLLVLCLVVTAAATQSESPPTTPPEDAEESAPFHDGQWVGTMSASGSAAADLGGVDGDLTTSFSGPIDFTVDDGEVTGGGELSGASVIWFTGAILGYITMQHAAWGELEGDSESLVFDGTHSTEGTAVALSPAQGRHPVGPNEGPFGPFDAEVVGFDCNRVLADWSTSFEAAALEGGWQTADIDGQLHADRFIIDLGPDLRDRAEQLLEDYNSWVDDVYDNVHADAEQAETVFDAELRAEIYELINRAVDLEFDIRGAGGDELCAFGTDLGRFSFVLTAMTQEVAIFILQGHAGLTGDTLRTLGNILSAMGGIGPGAIRAGKAEHIESLMEERGSEILEDEVVTDPAEAHEDGTPCTDARPCLDATQDVLEVLRAGAKHDLTFEAGGVEIDSEAADSLIRTAEG